MQPFRRGVPVKATLNQPRAAPRHSSGHPHLGSRYLRDFMPFLGNTLLMHINLFINLSHARLLKSGTP